MTDLRADCERCAGLCCVASGFSASADFAFDKPPGEPCPNLGPDFRCGIHADLPARGFAGCAAYDCFGAGQQVTQVTFGGRTWADDPAIAVPMFAAFTTMRQLHELLWYLGSSHSDLRAEIQQLTVLGPDELLDVDVQAHRRRVEVVLEEMSATVRGRVVGARPDLRGADLMGKDLRTTDLRGADLRGAYLIGADLRGAILTGADVLGADLRGADVRGADLSATLFVTQFQINAAFGDTTTTIPARLARPAWR